MEKQYLDYEGLENFRQVQKITDQVLVDNNSILLLDGDQFDVYLMPEKCVVYILSNGASVYKRGCFYEVTHTEISNPSGNPRSKWYYEKVPTSYFTVMGLGPKAAAALADTLYTRSQDTSVNPGKTYYDRNRNYLFNKLLYAQILGTMPTAGSAWDGYCVYYRGEDTADYKKGHTYYCSGSGSTYTWTDISLKGIQVTALPTASADELGNIYQYVGVTDTDYTNGYFYKCVSDGENPASYSWEEVEVQSKDTDKCIITIIDDDGTNRTNDTYTGILSFLNTRNIPLTLAVPSESPSKSSGTYNLAQLHEIESAGNEVIMHGVTNEDHTRNMTQAEFETMTDTMIDWANTNGFANDLFAYPGGAFVDNDDYGLNPKIEYLKTKGIKLAYGINQPVESALTTGYEDWYNYANGHDYFGAGNKVPFVTMPNGYSKALLANRMELKRDTLTKDWWKTRVRNFVENKVYITFFMHSWISEWMTPGDDDKTTTDLFEEFIQELIDDYGDKIEWRTASGALDIINSYPVTKAEVEQLISEAPHLEETVTLPTATVDNLNKCYLLTGTQTGYQKGGTYQCQYDSGLDLYKWVLISSAEIPIADASTNGISHPDDDTIHVDNTGVLSVDENYKKIYVGHKADWDALSTPEKVQYDEAHFDDDDTGGNLYPDWDNAESILTSGNTYTVTRKGYICGSFTRYDAGSSGSGFLAFTLNDIQLAVAQGASSYNSGATIPLTPVKEGDVAKFVVLSGSGTAINQTYSKIYFVPFANV